MIKSSTTRLIHYLSKMFIEDEFLLKKIYIYKMNFEI